MKLFSLFGRSKAKNDKSSSASSPEFQLRDVGNDPFQYLEGVKTEADVPSQPTTIEESSLLLVDDEPDLLAYLKDELSGTAKNIYLAKNGVEAVTVLKNHNVGLVVSDVMMPEMDGFALCRYIKTNVAISHIPVILLTARADENSRILGYKNGADDYITKPFNIITLEKTVNSLLKSRSSVREQFNKADQLAPIAIDSAFSSADEAFIRKLSKYVNDNISNPDFDISLLVDQMQMSRTLLYTKVKALTGLNIQGYITKARMDNAIRLLWKTDLSMADIATECGFNSAAYFSTSFKAFTGKTPSEFKSQLK